MGDVVVQVPATSALWDLDPANQPGGWATDKTGMISCPGGTRCAAEVRGVQFNQIQFSWTGGGQRAVSIGVDGQLSSGDAHAGSAAVPASQGRHSARIEVEPGGSDKDDLVLSGVRLQTSTAFTAPPRNYTLDDASSSITYSGWTRTTSTSAPLEAIRTGSFFANTVSYTGTAGSTASFSFTGQIIYIFGCTGPSFGVFEVWLDGASCGTYNATAGANTFGTLLWFGQAQGEGPHQVEVKNMVDGRLLALDYFVAMSAAEAGGPGWTTGDGAGPSAVGPTQPVSDGTFAAGPAPTAVFPAGSAQLDGSGNSSNSEIIGGILGTLTALLLLFFAFRYRQYKKAGGEGSFAAALFGPRKKATQTAGTAKNDFKLWPMIRSRPKYAT